MDTTAIKITPFLICMRNPHTGDLFGIQADEAYKKLSLQPLNPFDTRQHWYLVFQQSNTGKRNAGICIRNVKFGLGVSGNEFEYNTLTLGLYNLDIRVRDIPWTWRLEPLNEFGKFRIYSMEYPDLSWNDYYNKVQAGDEIRLAKGSYTNSEWTFEPVPAFNPELPVDTEDRSS